MIQTSADLDDQPNSISETSTVVAWTLEDTQELFESFEEKKFAVQRDDQLIEFVKSIHENSSLMRKSSLKEVHQEMKKMLSQQREKLKRIKDWESVWLFFKAWIWSIIIVFLFSVRVS